MQCLYCNQQGDRWSVESRHIVAPAILCVSHAADLFGIAQRLEADSRKAAEGGHVVGEGGNASDELGVIEDPEEVIRKLDQE